MVYLRSKQTAKFKVRWVTVAILQQRSRSKLFMWYGILGGRELLHQTYRNLDQRIRLECDGLPIDLPSLQVRRSTVARGGGRVR